MSKWKKYPPTYRASYFHPTNHHGGGRVSNGIELELGKNYSGSGLGSFNNFKEWPHLTLRMAFPAGRPELMKEFAEELKLLVEGFINKRNLLDDQTFRTRENTREEVWEEYGLK